MVHNVEFSCSHISFVWLHGLNSLQWWLLTCPDLTNVVWFKNNIDRHEYPKQLQAHPAKKSEIPDTRNTRWFWKKSGTDWVLPKIIGSDRVSGTRQALLLQYLDSRLFWWRKNMKLYLYYAHCPLFWWLNENNHIVRVEIDHYINFCEKYCICVKIRAVSLKV